MMVTFMMLANIMHTRDRREWECAHVQLRYFCVQVFQKAQEA